MVVHDAPDREAALCIFFDAYFQMSDSIRPWRRVELDGERIAGPLGLD